MAKEYIVNSKVHGKQIIILDNDDYENIVKNKIKLWINYAPTVHSCYAIFWKDNKRIRLHRFITNCPKDKVVDHINHNTLDNRKCNLRICTRFENNQNNSNNKTGQAGVYWSNRDKTFIVELNHKYLGRSKNLDEAIMIRRKAEELQKGKM